MRTGTQKTTEMNKPLESKYWSLANNLKQEQSNTHVLKQCCTTYIDRVNFLLKVVL